MHYDSPPYLLALADGTTTSVPTCWADLSLGQYDRLLGLEPDVDTYGWLASAVGTTRQAIQNLPNEVVKQVIEALQYLRVPPPAYSVPDVVRLPKLPSTTSNPGRFNWFRRVPDSDTVEVVPPKDLSLASFGQATDLGTMLERYEGNPGYLRLVALAIYLMPSYHGTYDTDLLPAMIETCKLVRLGEGLPLADFFILTLTGLPPGTGATLKKFRFRPQRSAPATMSLPPAGSLMPLPARLLGAMRLGWQQFMAGPGAK